MWLDSGIVIFYSLKKKFLVKVTAGSISEKDLGFEMQGTDALNFHIHRASSHTLKQITVHRVFLRGEKKTQSLKWV